MQLLNRTFLFINKLNPNYDLIVTWELMCCPYSEITLDLLTRMKIVLYMRIYRGPCSKLSEREVSILPYFLPLYI